MINDPARSFHTRNDLIHRAGWRLANDPSHYDLGGRSLDCNLAHALRVRRERSDDMALVKLVPIEAKHPVDGIDDDQ
jgi:hypothetical protein